MPSRLFKFERKPQTVKLRTGTRTFAHRHWKGPGFYYHRGNGKWQRYSVRKDERRKPLLGLSESKKRYADKKWNAQLHDSKRKDVRGRYFFV
jgi:hypothetical protein